MLHGKTILCFASGYDAPPTSKHHIMHLLAEGNVVLWVNYHASRAPAATTSDVRWICKKLSQVFKGLSRPRENLFVLTPLVIPLPGSARAKKWNRRLLTWQISRALKKITGKPSGGENLQIWSFAPDVSYLIDAFSPEKVVYYCVDEFSHFEGYDTEQVLADEKALCGRANLVVTTSEVLQNAKSPWNPNTILVPHGVDYDHFAAALREETEIPKELQALDRPILGFFGLIKEWVDLDLLADLANRRPDWSIVLLGDVTVDISAYRNIPNMHFMGRRSYAELPAWCKGFDAGLIPFKINQLTEAVNPIKLREYLSAGLPVISTPMPEVQRYKKWIHIVHSADEIINIIKEILNKSAPTRRSRSDAMSRETWPIKLNHIIEAL